MSLYYPNSRILLPRIKKYTDVYGEVKIGKPMLGIAGRFRFEVVNDDGRTWWLTDWFSNNITDAGLDAICTSLSRYNACQVGTGTNPPNNADTALQTYLAGTSTAGSTDGGYESTTYGWARWRYDFTTGAVVGNISEVGIGTETSGGTLFSRELIRDGAGNPTTLTILSSQALRVHYEVRYYIPQEDVVTEDVEIGGNLYDITRRACLVNSSDYWRPVRVSSDRFFGGSNINIAVWFTGSIGAITGQPSGSVSSNNTSTSLGSYSPGSFTRDATITWNESTANSSSLKSMRIECNLVGGVSEKYFQYEFNNPLTKTNLQTLTLTLTGTWGRYEEPSA